MQVKRTVLMPEAAGCYAMEHTVNDFEVACSFLRDCVFNAALCNLRPMLCTSNHILD